MMMKIPSIILVSILLVLAISCCSAIDPPKQFLRRGNNSDEDGGDDIHKHHNKNKANHLRRFPVASSDSSGTKTSSLQSLLANLDLPAEKGDSSTTEVVMSRALKAFVDTMIDERRQLDQTEEEGEMVEEDQVNDNPVQSDLFFGIFDPDFFGTLFSLTVFPIVGYFLILPSPIYLPVATALAALLLLFLFVFAEPDEPGGVAVVTFVTVYATIFLVIATILSFIVVPFIAVLAPIIYIVVVPILITALLIGGPGLVQLIVRILTFGLYPGDDDEDGRRMLLDNIMKQLKDDDTNLGHEGMSEDRALTDHFLGLFDPDLLTNLIEILELPI